MEKEKNHPTGFPGSVKTAKAGAKRTRTKRETFAKKPRKEREKSQP
jgi:hypothetical protein